MNTEIKIYEAGGKRQSFWSMVKSMFIDLKNSTDLAKRLFIRDRKSEYRQSFLGIFWAIFTPLMNSMVWIFLSASGAIAISDTGLPYPVFVLIGTLMWTVFTESVNMPLQQTNASKSLLTKVNFEKESIILAGFFNILFNLTIKMGIVFMILIFFGVPLTFNILLSVPFILLLSIFGLSLGLIISPIGMLYKDIAKIIPMGLSLMMYITPVVYKNAKIKSLETILQYNPLSPIINTIRDLLTGGGIENLPYMMVIAAITLLLLFVGWILYRISIPIIVERM